MARVTLLNLETLCCIARLGTFAAAAEQLHASQSAISARIRDMESSMGVALFRREGRRMELTSHGRELVERVDPLLQRLHGVVDSVENTTAVTGTLRIGAGEYAALSWFPSFMSQLRARLPRVAFQVDVDLTSAMAQKLQAGKLDVVILAGPLVGPDIRSVPVGSLTMGWFAAPSVASASVMALPAVERLAANPIWSLASPSASYGMTLSTLHDLGLVPEAISVCNHMAALVGMIVAGAGVALLPEILVRGHLAKFELVRLLPEMPETRLAFVVAWQGAAEQAVLRHVVELARQCTSFDIESSSGP